MGVDLKKDRATLELAYDDPAGVTAAFDRNLLVRINRELGADFDLRKFGHVVRYDERARLGRLPSSKRASAWSSDVQAPAMESTFEPGERIHTESSYKFADEDVARSLPSAGFRAPSVWHDRAKRFSVHLLVRTKGLVDRRK